MTSSPDNLCPCCGSLEYFECFLGVTWGAAPGMTATVGGGAGCTKCGWNTWLSRAARQTLMREYHDPRAQIAPDECPHCGSNDVEQFFVTDLEAHTDADVCFEIPHQWLCRTCLKGSADADP